MAHSTNENYRPSRKYGFGGGLAVGSLLGAYIGYKIGRARGTKKGGTFDTEKKIYKNVKSKFAEGGGIGFKGLANKVAKRYEGKSVAPKYQGEYGKRYSKSEAQEVGRKVAGKVYQQQQSKKFDSGGNIDDLIYG